MKSGLSIEAAETGADVLSVTDSWGIHTHGVKNLRGYIRRVQAGGIRPNGVPRIEDQSSSWVKVDGDAALGMVAADFSIRQAVQKAEQCGIGFVGLRNSCHFGAAGYYSWIAARKGCIGVSMSNDIPTVSGPGSRGPVLGSNPFSYCIPTGDDRPILMDFATSTVAGGKVFAAAARGESIPEGWIVDQDGKPTQDPGKFPNEASLTPMAGHKGYGLALFIEVLSAVITGAAVTNQVLSFAFEDASLPTNHGAAFIAIRPDLFMGSGLFQTRIHSLIAEIRSVPVAEGSEQLGMPGDREWNYRERSIRDGIEFPEAVQKEMELLSEEMAIPFS
jgi:LDH2 family malate/lactate/ureidoglycolate dehydrogenase